MEFTRYTELDLMGVFPLNGCLFYDRTLDLHIYMAVDPPMSLGVCARKFLRST